jgi:ABC-type sugar transport system permease subunit
MTTEVLASRPSTRGDVWWLTPLLVWQAVYAAAAAIAVALVTASTGIVITGTPRLVAIGIVVILAVSAALSVLWIVRRNHKGRLAAFLLNLVLAVGAGFLALQETNIFNGLDSLGATFGTGIPFLALMAVGWLIAGWAGKVTGPTGRALRLAARWLVIIGFALLLIRVGLLPGLWTFLTRLVQPAALIPAAVAVVASLWTKIMLSDEPNPVFRSTKAQLEVMDGLFFVSPNVLGFLAFLGGPLAFSFFVSFTNWDGLSDAAWVGIRNYTDLITDPFFLKSLRNILYFGVLAVPLSVLPALGLAALLNTKLPGMKIFRALYFLPAVAGVVGVALIWKQLYNSTVGYINYGLVRLWDLVNLLPGLDLTPPQPQWLSSPSTAMLSMVIVFSFSTIGLNTVLFLAGLQSVPGELYEAAELDGAGPWSKFRRITIPMLAPTTVFVVITTTILALQLFSEPFILNAPQLSPNGPGNATLTPVIYLYQNAFERFNQGYASAIGWALFLLIFAITIIYFRTQRDRGVLSA